MATHAAATRNLSGLARALAQHGLMTEFDAEALQTQAFLDVPYIPLGQVLGPTAHRANRR